MTTRDSFLDALTMPAPAPVRSPPAARPSKPSWIAKPTSLPPDPPKINARPDFADDIDRRVADMIEAGQVVFDAEMQIFKATPHRRIRFA